jgi:hypothetical protein
MNPPHKIKPLSKALSDKIAKYAKSGLRKYQNPLVKVICFSAL